METKYLVLEFKNAGFFRKHKRTNDFIFDAKGKRQRANSLFYKEPITVHQVSNVIHVLFGERPKPSLREVVFGNVDYYHKKAMQSYLKIDSYKRLVKKKDGEEKEEYISEILQCKKVVNDSWSKNTFMNWERVSKHLGKEFFDELISILNDMFGIKNVMDKYSYMEARDEAMVRGFATVASEKNTKKTKLDIFFDKLVKNQKSPIMVNFIYPNRRTEITKAANIKATVHIAPEKITKLNGEIIIPVNEDDLLKLSNGKGCATILDGGTVFIRGVLTENEVNVSNHTKVSEISTDKY